MKLSIGKFEIVGHRPRQASRSTTSAGEALNRAGRMKDCLPFKWRQRPTVESIVRARLDDDIATPSIGRTLEEKEHAFQQIDHWVARSPAEHRESYQRVADQIKACWEADDVPLALHSEHIRTLPPLPTTLTSLEIHDCANLISVPSVAGFAALTSLTIFHCGKLTTGPDTSGCTGLIQLTIRDCAALTSVPDVEGCTALVGIDIRRCSHLTALPDTSMCTALAELIVRDCPVRSLPENILTLSQDCLVRVSIDHLSEAVRNRLAVIMNGPGYTGPRMQFDMGTPEIIWSRPLSDEITSWRYESTHNPNANDNAQVNWDDRAAETTQSFSTFLGRLRETQEYLSVPTKAQFQQRVCALIDQLEQPDNADLQALCFAQAEHAINTCGDRVALAFMGMENACTTRQAEHDVSAGKYDDNPTELVRLGRGMYRLQTLQIISRDKVATRHFVDEIEVHLGYLVNLSQEFALPVQMRSMLYPRCTHLDESDIHLARERLSTDENHHHLLAYLTTWSPMDLYLKRHHAQAFVTLADAVSTHVAEQKKALYGRLNSLDSAANDYQQRCTELMLQFDALETTISAQLKGDLIREKMDLIHLD